MLHITQWTLILMLYIRQSIYLVLTNVLSTLFLMFHIKYIWWNQHNTVYTILIKVDILHTCGAMICSYFGIAFLLFFMKIENTVYTSCQKSTFINGLIFDIINIQITSLLNLNENQLALLRSVNDRRLSWLRNVFLKSFQRLAEFCSATPMKLYKRCWSKKCSYRGRHISDWK